MDRNGFIVERPATKETFDEESYLAGNPDVAAAVARGKIKSGRAHFDIFGWKEGRSQRLSAGTAFREIKARKLARIEPLLRRDMPRVDEHGCADFLTPELRRQFAIVDTDAVSSNDYDPDALGLVEKHRDGLILDCGARRRRIYYENVVNFDIAPYDTTDVRGVGEALPFVEGACDCVFSLAVLEHVKDPLRAREKSSAC
jgi:Methyltransferase domain